MADPDVWDDPLAPAPTSTPASTLPSASSPSSSVPSSTPSPTPSPPSSAPSPSASTPSAAGVRTRSLWGGSPPRTAEQTAQQEEAVARCVRRAFDAGTARVDLSDLALAQLPIDEILSLRFFTPGSDGLHLFLSRNALVSFPRAILALADTLTVLSLRGNKLEHLPAEIRCLRQLRDLSIGGNKLTHLPWELQALPHLKALSAQPNNFVDARELAAKAVPAADKTPAMPTLQELCLRALYRTRAIPEATTAEPLSQGIPSTVVASSSPQQQQQPGLGDALAPYLKAAPVLDALPVDVALAAATGRCWCATCDAVMATPTVERIVYTKVRGLGVPVPLQYRYCTLACAAAGADTAGNKENTAARSNTAARGPVVEASSTGTSTSVLASQATALTVL